MGIYSLVASFSKYSIHNNKPQSTTEINGSTEWYYPVYQLWSKINALEMATDKLVHKRLYYLMMHTENIQISAWVTEHAVEHLSLDNKWVSMVYSKGTSCRHFFF